MNGSSPWREPMVWLVFGIPAATLVAAIVLVFILATEQEQEPTQEQGQAQGREMAPGLPPP